MEQKIVINIGRQFGSGGRIIGEKLSTLMNIQFFDKELILIASKESGLGKEFFENVDEKSSHSIFGGLFGLRGAFSDEMVPNNFLSNETLFKIQSDVIRDLAEKQSCIFVGRCADYVLKDHPHCLNLFVSADIDDRIKRIAEKENLPENKAKELIEKTDKKRASYYNYYSNKVWGAASSYHLCINSSFLGIDESVTFIKEFAEKRFEK
jgi:shikimate kinase